MRFARREIEEPSINLTSLIDIVFLLLIFFMVSTRFVGGPELSVTLPAASEATQVVREQPITVVVDAHDRYYIDGESIAAAQLATILAELNERQSQRTLVLRADGQATHAAVVRVLDIAAGQGFDSVDIAVSTQEN